MTDDHVIGNYVGYAIDFQESIVVYRAVVEIAEHSREHFLVLHHCISNNLQREENQKLTDPAIVSVSRDILTILAVAEITSTICEIAVEHYRKLVEQHAITVGIFVM